MDSLYHLMFKILLKINKTLHFWDRSSPCPQGKNMMKTYCCGPYKQSFSLLLGYQILGWQWITNWNNVKRSSCNLIRCNPIICPEGPTCHKKVPSVLNWTSPKCKSEVLLLEPNSNCHFTWFIHEHNKQQNMWP
jgi:hypothetical protein